MRPPAILLLPILVSCATAAPKVALVEVTPAPGSKITADSRLRIVTGYSWLEHRIGDRVILTGAVPGKDPARLREAGVREADGRVVFDLQALDAATGPYAGPFELQVALQRWDRQQGRITVTASEKVTFTADMTDFEGHELHYLSPKDGRAQITIDPTQEPYRPRLPPALNRDGMVVWGRFKVCVDDGARVFHVSALESADFLVDADWMRRIQTWGHRPYLVDGVAVYYCYPVRVEVRSRQ